MDKERFKYWLRIESFCLRQFGSGEKWELIQFRFVMVLISHRLHGLIINFVENKIKESVLIRVVCGEMDLVFQ